MERDLRRHNSGPQSIPGMHWLTRRVLGVPLVIKLIGANVILIAVAVLVNAFAFAGRASAEIWAVLLALTIASIVNFILVRLALQPVKELEALAARLSAGDFTSRSAASPFADADLARLGSTINELLDSLQVERRRIQDLGAEVIYAQDAERSRVSRELHDSIAQTLAAARFQLTAAGFDSKEDVPNRIATVNSLVGTALEEIKNVSYSLHPRVAEDLGLESALNVLAQQVRARSGIEVAVHCTMAGPPIQPNLRTTLFRVAQEALRNIEVHSQAKNATVDIEGREGSIWISIGDDGCGFNPDTVVPRPEKSGLASVKDRVLLAGGVMNVDSVPNGGTRVTVELRTLRAAS